MSLSSQSCSNSAGTAAHGCPCLQPSSRGISSSAADTYALLQSCHDMSCSAMIMQALTCALCRPSSGGASKLPVLQAALPSAQSPLPAKPSTPAQVQADPVLGSSSKAFQPASSAQEQQQPLKAQVHQQADQGHDRVVRAPPSGGSAQKQQSPGSSRQQQRSADSVKGTPKKTARSSSPGRGAATAVSQESCQSITASPPSRMHASANTRPAVRWVRTTRDHMPCMWHLLNC